jgi:hypothetical protein
MKRGEHLRTVKGDDFDFAVECACGFTWSHDWWAR